MTNVEREMTNKKKITSLVPATATYRQAPTANCSAFLRASSWLILFFTLPLLPQSKANKFPMQKSLTIQTDQVIRATLNTNEWSYWVLWDGQSGRNPLTGDSGGLFPFRQISCVFADGIVWGGIVDDSTSALPLRVGGSTYISSSRPGRILPSGEAQDPAHAEVRLYRVRPDFASLTDIQLRSDAAEQFEKSIVSVTEAEIELIRSRYQADWEDWPGDLGAPYVDVNENDAWDPGTDIPGMANARQTIWHVTNDLDVANVQNWNGSLPLGLEIQNTFWISDNASLDDIFFRRVRLINKSGFDIDDMYIGIWSDMDLGDFGDDFVGSDSLLGLAYVYNGADEDRQYAAIGLPPAAAGHLLLQGPLVEAPGDAAIFDFRTVTGYRNLSAIGFGYQAAGSPLGVPPLGDYHFTLGWYNRLRGYTPTFDIANPTPREIGSGPRQGQPTKWPLSGDPVTDPMGLAGDVDGAGNNFPPGDRRYWMSSGPFVLAAGDTQEIVLATIGALDHVNGRYGGITKLKTVAENLKQAWFEQNAYPEIDVRLTPGRSETTVQIQVDLRNSYDASSANIQLSDPEGRAPDIDISLFDDGQHSDGVAGDKIWGSVPVTVANRRYPNTATLKLITESGNKEFPGISDAISLRPRPQLVNVRQTWEDGRQDNYANHGETIHISYDLYFPDDANDIEQLTVNGNGIESLTFLNDSRIVSPDFRFTAVAPQVGDSLAISWQMQYDLFRIDGEFKVPIKIWDPTTLWQDTLDVVKQSGNAANLLPIIADASLITGDQYLVEFMEDPLADEPRWQLRNVTTAEILLENQTVAADASHPFPVVDGIQFQVTTPGAGFLHFQTVANAAGPIDPPVQAALAFSSNGFPTHDGQPLIPGVNDRPDASRQQTNGSTWGIHTGGTTDRSYVAFLAQVLRGDNAIRALPFDYELRFTDSENWANVGGTVRHVPFEMWNIGSNTVDDPSDDFRMIPLVLDEVSFAPGRGVFNLNPLDHVVSGVTNDPQTDQFTWRDPDDRSPGDAGYQQFVNDSASGNYGIPGTEVMARMCLVNWNGGDVEDPTFPANVDALMPETGTVFRIITHKPNYPGDRLLVDTAPVFRPELFYPKTFFLDQNYPNPFNPETTIEFALPEAVDVKLEVFNVLGQRVKILMDESLEPAGYRVIWDGSDSNGSQMASGIYFYRISAGRFVKTRKMILLR